MNGNAALPGQTEAPHHAHRHSILDLAPLELECMSVLWAMGEGSVRDIHRKLAEHRPRAYTTIMTIMDRLARKGVAARRKQGRAYTYQPRLSADQARVSAVEKVVVGFFHGSVAALAAHLAERKETAAADSPGELASIPSAENPR